MEADEDRVSWKADGESIRMSNFPQPSMHKTWEEWAEKLVQALETSPDLRPLLLPVYSISTLPKAVPQGQLIFVSDDFEGNIVAYADGTVWRRISDMEEIG